MIRHRALTSIDQKFLSGPLSLWRPTLFSLPRESREEAAFNSFSRCLASSSSSPENFDLPSVTNWFVAAPDIDLITPQSPETPMMMVHFTLLGVGRNRDQI